MTVAMAGPAPASIPASRLRIVGPPNEPDLVAARRAVGDLLVALGRDPADPHLAETPARVADSLAEMLTPAAPFDLTTFPNDEGYDELIVARDIPVHSLCQHHLLPFYGVAHVGYLPGQRILGLSKLARVVELFARDLQVQERLTQQVANWLQVNLAPRGVGGGYRGRAPVHVSARCPRCGSTHGYLCRARVDPRRRPHPARVLRSRRRQPLTIDPNRSLRHGTALVSHRPSRRTGPRIRAADRIGDVDSEDIS